MVKVFSENEILFSNDQKSPLSQCAKNINMENRKPHFKVREDYDR